MSDDRWHERVRLRYKSVPSWAPLALAWLLVPWPMVRAWDYATGIDATARPVLDVFMVAMPTAWWAVLFATCGGVLLAGLSTRLHALTWAGHGLMASAYTGLAISLGQGAIAASDGWRSVGPVLVLAVLHLALSALLGPLPPRREWRPGDAD